MLRMGVTSLLCAVVVIFRCDWLGVLSAYSVLPVGGWHWFGCVRLGGDQLLGMGSSSSWLAVQCGVVSGRWSKAQCIGWQQGMSSIVVGSAVWLVCARGVMSRGRASRVVLEGCAHRCLGVVVGSVNR